MLRNVLIVQSHCCYFSFVQRDSTDFFPKNESDQTLSWKNSDWASGSSGSWWKHHIRDTLFGKTSPWTKSEVWTFSTLSTGGGTWWDLDQQKSLLRAVPARLPGDSLLSVVLKSTLGEKAVDLNSEVANQLF